MCLSSLVYREPPLEWKAEGSYCNIIRTSHPFQCVNPHLYANAQYGIDFIKDIIMFAAANQTCPIDVFSIWKCGRQYSTVIAKITPHDVCRDAYHLSQHTESKSIHSLCVKYYFINAESYFFLLYMRGIFHVNKHKIFTFYMCYKKKYHSNFVSKNFKFRRNFV